MDRLTRRNFLGTAGLAATAPVLGAVAAQAQARGGSVAVEKNVVFGTGGDMDLRCDLYRPAPGTEKRTATIHLHGGGFTGGSKETLSERVQPYAAQGYLAIASQYRLIMLLDTPTFGQIQTQAGDPRILQFGVKYGF
jgi:acetyl esterase/lipase